MAIAKYYIKRYGMIALIMNILTLLFLFIFQNFSAVYMLVIFSILSQTASAAHPPLLSPHSLYRKS